MTDSDSTVDVDGVENGYNYSEYRVYDVQGTLYVVGLDQYGYVSIQAGESYVTEDGDTVMWVRDDRENVNFPPAIAADVGEYIQTLV